MGLGGKIEGKRDSGQNVSSQITVEALAAELFDTLQRRGDHIHDERGVLHWLRNNREPGRTALATIEGVFRIEERVSIGEWTRALRESAHVTLFLDVADRRSRVSREVGNPHGIWVGMATECIVESKHETGHVPVVMRGTNGALTLLVTGWLETSGYLNPLVAYW